MVGRSGRRYKTALVLCARWEAAHIEEWIVYHRSIGFDHIYVYSNDDDPNDLFDVVRPLQILAPDLITYNHYKDRGNQREMYLHFWEHYGDEVEWAMALDADEFLNTNGETISELVGRVGPRVGAIYFNWVMFGNSGFRERPSGLVLTQYLFRQTTVHPYTKNIVRSEAVDVEQLRISGHAGFWHGWEHSGPDNVLRSKWRNTINVLGDTMSQYYIEFPEKANAYLADKHLEILSQPRIHHYSMRSEADFLLREARGLDGAFRGQKHWGDIFRNGTYVDYLASLNAVRDESLAELWKKEILYSEAP